MATKRKTNDCPVKGPCPRGFDVDLANISGRVNHLDSLLPGIATDVRSISNKMNAMEVHLATIPTWDNVKELNQSVKNDVKVVAEKIAVLEEAGAQIKGGWKLLTFVGGVSGSVVAIISWFVQHFPKP